MIDEKLSAAAAEEEQLRTDAAVYVIRPDGVNTFRVMCLNDLPLHLFDVFGILAPVQGDAECSVVQRILEHMDQCTPGHRPASTEVKMNIKDRLNPIYTLVVRWV